MLRRRRCTLVLNEDVTTTKEILLRIRPDEPAHLIHASVVCKPWFSVVSGFLRRYRTFHQCAPLLGFFYNLYSLPAFLPTTSAPSPPRPVEYGSRVARRTLDCCHGRVLLIEIVSGNFVAWDPFSNQWDELRVPWHASHYDCHSNAVVLCAVAALSMWSVWVSILILTPPLAHVYSSESPIWGTTASAQLPGLKYIDMTRAALIGDGIYFTANYGGGIVKYDLVEHRLSLILMPRFCYNKIPILMRNEDDSLGIAGVLVSSLYIWSTMVDAETSTYGHYIRPSWVLKRVINLEEILQMGIISVQANVICFAEGIEVFFVSTNVGAFTFELKSGRVRKVGEPRDYSGINPFISFFTPDHGCSKWTK